MINHVFIEGRIVDKPEVKSFKRGGKTAYVTNFRIANQIGSDKENVHFFDVTIFNSVGEKLVKGQDVAIDGRLEQNRYEKDGEKVSRVKIIAEQIVFGSVPLEK
jgi:single-strand DNA-binding protein